MENRMVRPLTNTPPPTMLPCIVVHAISKSKGRSTKPLGSLNCEVSPCRLAAPEKKKKDTYSSSHME